VTIPFERTRSLILTKEFLQRLRNPKETPRVPKAIRLDAQTLLRHFPTYADIEQAHQALPELYGPVPPFSRLRCNSQVDGILEASGAPITPISTLVSDLVRVGRLLSETVFIERTGWTQRSLSKALADNRVFVLESEGARYFPAFYAGERYDRKQLGAVCKALGDVTPGGKLQFFLTAKGSLNRRTPLEALASGDVATVLAIARAFAEA
jgi:hypothetical protein